MAFLSHGCAVVSKTKSTVEPLVWSVMPEEVAGITPVELQSRTDAARKWHETNAAWNVLARKISGWIESLRA
jgi:hypothetical protein